MTEWYRVNKRHPEFQTAFGRTFLFLGFGRIVLPEAEQRVWNLELKKIGPTEEVALRETQSVGFCCVSACTKRPIPRHTIFQSASASRISCCRTSGQQTAIPRPTSSATTPRLFQHAKLMVTKWRSPAGPMPFFRLLHEHPNLLASITPHSTCPPSVFSPFPTIQLLPPDRFAPWISSNSSIKPSSPSSTNYFQTPPRRCSFNCTPPAAPQSPPATKSENKWRT